jgi:hypothetical protein
LTDRAPPSAALLEGWHLLEQVHGLEPLGDLAWDAREQRWVIHVECQLATPNTTGVPQVTDWYFVVSPRYPWGPIEIYPSKRSGFCNTFPHQDYNAEGDVDRPWRLGDVCVRERGFTVGAGSEPKGDVTRLQWLAHRLTEWIDHAAAGTLTKIGDHFELPRFPTTGDTVVGFYEDEVSYAAWCASPDSYGLVDLVSLGSTAIAAKRFLSPEGKVLCEPLWGRTIRETGFAYQSVWLRLPAVPLAPPFGAPMTWGELFSCMGGPEHGPRLLYRCLGPLYRSSITAPGILLLGFPIPQSVGGPNLLMRWQPMLLPPRNLMHRRRGFRDADGFRRWEMQTTFRPDRKLSWLTGENWSRQALASRGQLHAEMRSRRILLVGAGSLSAVLAELLVRGGVERLTLVDNDRLKGGNLVRHSLALDDVGQYKAPSLAKRLNQISPHAEAVGLPLAFPGCLQSTAIQCGDFDLIIDCTGSDDVVAALADLGHSHSATMCSLSIARSGARMYAYSATAREFSSERFFAAVMPCLVEDNRELPDADLPWEGVGCWCPVLPVRADAVALLAARAINWLEEVVTTTPTGFRVIDRHG